MEDATQTIECLKAMREASERLREALIGGRADEIQAQVAEHERLAERLRLLMAERPAVREASADGEPAAARGAIRELTQAIRRIHRTNHALASTFCETVDRTIRRLCAAGGETAGTYGINGAITERMASVLVHQEG